MKKDIKNNKYLTTEEFVKYSQNLGMSVTHKVKTIKQKFISQKMFEVINLKNDMSKKMYKNQDAKKFSASVGLIVDYLTRLYFTKNVWNSFSISIEGCESWLKKEKLFNKKNKEYLENIIDELNDNVNNENIYTKKDIFNAYNLVRFDAYFRSGYINPYWLNSKNEVIDSLIPLPIYLINNILNVINNAISYLKTLESLDFNITFTDKDYEYSSGQSRDYKNIGGYSIFVNKGDGDFISKDTIYDFKCSTLLKSQPEWYLQVLLYYLMAKHSNQDKYKNITKIAIYNPIQNKVEIYDMQSFDKNKLYEINLHIMGYDFNPKKDIARIDNIHNPEAQYFINGCEKFDIKYSKFKD